MILRALHARGFLDISSNATDVFVGPPLRITLRPGQQITIDDSYRSISAISNAVNSGLLQIVSYANEADGYVVAEQVQQLIDQNDTVENYLGAAHATETSGIHGVTGNVVGTSDAQTLTTKTITNYGEGVGVLGNCAGAEPISLATANVFTGTITAETTFSFTNPRASGTATSFVLILTNGGAFTVNWPNSVYWPDGTAPSLTASGIDVLTFITVNGGTVWHGTVAQAASAAVA